MQPMRFLLLGVMIGLAVYLITGGHVLFLPLLFFLPLGLFSFGRRRDRERRKRWL